MAINITGDVAVLNYFDADGGMYVSQGADGESDGIAVFYTERQMHGQRIEISLGCVIPFGVAFRAMVMFFETGGARPDNVDWCVL